MRKHRKAKYTPQALLTELEQEKRRAKWRVQYAKSQLDAGHEYHPIHDLAKDIGYGMPSGALPKQPEVPSVDTEELRKRADEYFQKKAQEQKEDEPPHS